MTMNKNKIEKKRKEKSYINQIKRKIEIENSDFEQVFDIETK